jgi:hypothetical protein
MADGFGEDEDVLQGRQDAKLFPVGQALRATYDADNHATLSQDVTKLMLDLARVPFEPHEFQPFAKAPPTIAPIAPPLSWLARARLALLRARRA